MPSFFSSLDSYFNSSFSLIIIAISLILKSFILTVILVRGIKNTSTKRPIFFLCGLLIGSMAADVAWIYSLIRTNWFPNSDYRPYLFLLRIAWGFAIVQFQSFSLFMESLIDQSSRFNIRQKIFIAINTIFLFFVIYIAFADINCFRKEDRPSIELFMRTMQTYFALFILVMPNFFIVIHRLRKKNLPTILEKQLHILLPLLLVPIWISDVLQVFPNTFNSFGWITNSYFAMCISTILITIAAAYCARKVITLRFLNLVKHVQTRRNYNFVDDFKEVLIQFGGVVSITDVGIITKHFFSDSYKIPATQINFYVRNNNATVHVIGSSSKAISTINAVDHFMRYENSEIVTALYEMQILIHDEVSFSNFYEPNGVFDPLLSFLNTINAEIFIPIYEKRDLIGYIIIEQYAHPGVFFGDAERDEMLVFVSYLSNLINLLHNKNIDLIMEKKQEVEEELYVRQQEIKQYRESFRSFLRNNRLKDIGVIFYKNKQFLFTNKAAKDMIPVNGGIQEGHIYKALKDLVHRVEEYRTPQTCMTEDTQGNTVTLNAFFHEQEKLIVITAHYPAVSELVKRRMSLLENPNEWDYLLYLETTESGKLINQLLPGSGQTLLNFKITLLKAALSKQAILLTTMYADDLNQMVELVHHVSLREQLEVISLQTPCKNNDMTVKIFGINPMLNAETNMSTALLSALDGIGTLFIENIHFLDKESQDHLADFLRYGLYSPCKGEQKYAANVRIICSTDQNLATLVHKGTFSQELYHVLKEAVLQLPSLTDLSEEELSAITDGFTHQCVKKYDLKTLISLSEKEKVGLLQDNLVSFAQLKNRVQQLLYKKSMHERVYRETHVDDSYNATDPELIEAARLGKQALKNPRIMTLLWDTFKNQAKIAEFLDVNRSSVNRRCKEYNLQ